MNINKNAILILLIILMSNIASAMAQSNNDDKIIKTYTGEFPFYGTILKHSADYCTYKYYESGLERIYHGSFLLRTNVMELFDNEVAANVMIKGEFKNGNREGIWEFRVESSKSLQITRVTFQKGTMNGSVTYRKTDKEGKYAGKITDSFDGNYNGFKNMFIGNYTKKRIGSSCEAIMDEDGYLNGIFKCSNSTDRIQCDFVEGVPSSIIIQNMQTGEVRVNVTNPSFDVGKMNIYDWIENTFDYRCKRFIGYPFVIDYDIVKIRSLYDASIGLVGYKNIPMREQIRIRQIKELEEKRRKEMDEMELVAPKFVTDVGISFSTYLSKHIEYPANNMEQGKNGIVEVTFVIQSDKKISEIAITKSAGYDFNKAVLREIEKMNDLGLWQPAMMKGNFINAKIIQSVEFVCEGDKKYVRGLSTGFRLD